MFRPEDEARLRKLYTQIAAYIRKYCQKLGCTPRRQWCFGLCCGHDVCDEIEMKLLKQGITVTRPGKTFVKNGRCVLPPYQRPLCAIHACDRLQYSAGKRFFDHFLDLRNDIEQLEILRQRAQKQ